MGSGVSQPAAASKKKSISRQDFIFSSKIGEGGFSNVLSCMHVPSKTWMAIKETNICNVVKFQSGLQMISSEVEILSSLGEFPFIINMLFAFYDVKHMYIVLDLHQGADLRYHIRKNNVPNERMAAYLMICMSAALHYIHKRGILHRDVKPENIIFSGSGVPYLTDFGVSYQHRDHTTEIICSKSSGTRQYLAPEVFTKCNRHGVEADFWSLGIVLYEAMYSRRPFLKHCPVEMIHFQDDLCRHEVFLSSTSVAFADKSRCSSSGPPVTAVTHTRRHSYMKSRHLKSRQSLESMPEEDSEELRTKDVTSAAIDDDDDDDDDDNDGGGNDNDDGDDNDDASAVTDDKKEDTFINHWLFVSRTIREHSHLSNKLQQLQQQAAADLILEAEDYSPRGDSFQHKCVFYDTRQSLPQPLRPLCPRYTRAHGQISHACVAVIEGLLDLRRWSRLGAGCNYRALKNHEWFSNLDLNWSSVINRTTAPPFTPDTQQIAKTLANTYRYHYLENTQTKEQKEKYNQNQLPQMTIEESRTLSNFHYVNPKFQ
jgi:serine/threonine protein kinase